MIKIKNIFYKQSSTATKMWCLIHLIMIILKNFGDSYKDGRCKQYKETEMDSHRRI